MIEYFPNQPDYLNISDESSCNTLMQAMKTDGLTDRHPKHEDDIGSAKPDMKRVP